MRPRFARLRQLFSTPNENALLPKRRPLRVEPLEGRWLLSIGPLHVDADSMAPTPDGLAWETAYPDLQDALDQAEVLNADGAAENDITAIWIAEGTYKPSAQEGFSMLDGVSLYGGFYGDEADLDSRHGTETILSGDRDASGDHSSGDAYHVVYADNVTDVTLDDLTITGGNAFDRDGGGVYNSGSLTITGSTISGNSADDDGGGIYSSGVLTITGSTIASNSTDRAGGIFNYSGTLTVTASTISGNSGGGINSYNGTLTATNSIVSLNVDANGADIEGSLTIDSGFNLIGVDPRFVQNPSPGADGTWGTADDDPGDLHLTAESPAINLGDSSAVPPQLVTDLDGLPRIHGGRVDIGAYEYQADPPAGREIPSAVVTIPADTVDLYDGLVSLREALFYGGVEEIVGPITFDAALDASEITLAGSSLSVDWSVQIDASSLSSLSINADNKSRVFTIFVGEVDLVGLTITGGSAWYGGGVYSYGALTVTGSTISDNSAGSRGGGIHSSGVLTLIDSTITDNSANHSGGGISKADGTLTISGSTIASNSADRGGGIYSYSGTLTITNSTISRNSSNRGGGGILSVNGTLTVTNSTIADNSAGGGTVSGGGVFGDGTLLMITDSTISGNSAFRGGGIQQIHGGSLTVTDSMISGNSARDGGGVYCDSILMMTNSTISGNSAVANGGAIYHLRGTVTLTGSTVLDNSATEGGGIYIYGSLGTVTLTGSTVLDNSATNGGGIYNAGTLTLNNSTIAGNSATEGGGIYSSNTLTVTGSMIAGNSATEGGGIYNSSTVTLTGSMVSGNSASYKGGGIRNAFPGTLTVSGSTIFGNSAEHGGGMYGSGTMTAIGSTITGNSADNRGGGILISAGWGTLTVHNTIIAGNTPRNDGPDIHGLVEDTSSHNLIGDGSEMSGIEDGVNGNLVGTAADPIDPRFVRMPSAGVDRLWGTEDDDYGDLRLLSDSPAIDAGDDAWAVDADGNPLVTDMGGNPRISGECVDMGAYETQPVPGEIHGTVFNDHDGDGIRDQREPGMPRWKVYLDQNENGLWDLDELFDMTGPHGEYSFAEVPMGTYIVGLVPRTGWTQTLPDPDAGGFHTVAVGSGQTVEDVLFGNRAGRRAGRGANGSNGHVFSEQSDWLSQLDLAAPKSARKGQPERAVGRTQWVVDCG